MKQLLPYSPVLPVQPDWKQLACALSEAYFTYERIKQLVAQGKADGKDYWTAYNDLEIRAAAISCWRDDPELYGRLLAQQAWLRK